MLEMSVEKETVVAGDGCGGSLPHLHASKDMHPPKMLPVGEPVAPLLASVGLTEGGVVGVCAVGGKPLQPKNGLPSGPQKLGKRRYSMNVSMRPAAGVPKRRRRASESQPVLPSHFLLGGNIFDPLNLNSLLDEEVSRALNAHTPETSPLPAKNREPLEILVPKDITDPLNLSGRSGGGQDGVLLSPLKRRRHRNRHHGMGPPEQAEPEKVKPAGGGGAPGSGVAPRPPSAVVDEPRGGAVALLGLNQMQDSPQPYELNTSINCRDEVVPPILPRRHSQTGNAGSASQPPGGADGTLCGQASSRSRKRRRTVSRSDRLSITPTPTIGPSADRGSSQTFQTPIVGGAKGSLHASSSQPSQKPRKPLRKYQYGNYSRYYGYRRPGLMEDPRLAVLKPEWFRKKKVLDLGCNTGHITLAIAKHWDPAHILGVDIDGGLVRAARQNLRHYLSEVQPTGSLNHHRGSPDKMAAKPKQEVAEETVALKAGKKGEHSDNDGKGGGGGGVFAALMDLQLTAAAPSAVRRPFLLSLRLCRGPITAPPIPEASRVGFPHNVFFMKENYVLEREEQLAGQQEEYDVILCLGLTLWVQLNWGDGGLQRLFRRAHRQLRTGGIFILEPQPWSSYSRRKRISETTYRNYCSIRLKPDHFTSYLTSEVGFSSYELLGTPNSSGRGFQRPIYLFHKGPASSRK